MSGGELVERVAAALRERWQEAKCPHTLSGICVANCEPACRCQNGEDTFASRFRFGEALR